MKQPPEELETPPPPGLRLLVRLERGENALFSVGLALPERLLLIPLLYPQPFMFSRWLPASPHSGDILSPCQHYS